MKQRPGTHFLRGAFNVGRHVAGGQRHRQVGEHAGIGPALGTLLALPLAAQVQPDWRQTYESPVPPAGCRDQVTALAIAPSGDIFWASDHAWHNTTAVSD